jgi:thiol:disulfide interchange protein DsbC
MTPAAMLVLRRRWLLLLAAVMVSLIGVAMADELITRSAPADTRLRDVEARLHQSFPQLRADRVVWSQVPELAEVTSGTQVVYYAPAADLLLIGDLIDRNGESLTQQRIAQLQRAAIPVDAGVIAGEGRRELIVFVDPDCGYCARAAAWLQSQPDIRIRLVFMPLQPGSPAEARARAFVCLPPSERLAAVLALFLRAGGDASAAPCAAAPDLLARHAEIATAAGIRATPTFFIGAQTVQGFDPARLQAALDARPLDPTHAKRSTR